MNTRRGWSFGAVAFLGFVVWLVGGMIGRACADGICASEQSSAKATPDQATLAVSVESTNEDVDVALQKNADSLGKLKEYFKKEGVRALETDPAIIESRYAQNYTSGVMAKTVNGYNVRTTVTAQITKLSDLKILTAGALMHGATALLAVQLGSSQLGQAKTQARQQALEKAKAKALDMAKQVGQSAGLVTTVDETAVPQVWSTFATMSAQRSEAQYAQMNLLTNNGYGYQAQGELPLESDKLVVTSSVRVCMEFKDLAAREKH